jgi:3-hydroxybutyryl-CoA dehydratase
MSESNGTVDAAVLERPPAAPDAGGAFTTRGRTITESDVVSFAALTGDWHPQHADAAWAAGSRFGERVAHGMLVLSYAIGLVPLDPERVVALRGLDGVVFKRPVLIGDTIHVEGRIDGMRPIGDGHALVRMAWKIVNQSGQAVARAKLDAVWRMDEGSEHGESETERDSAPEQVFL